MFKAIAFIIVLIGLALPIGAVVGCVVQEYRVEKDIGSWLDRAQVAANATSMHGYLQKVRAGLEERGMTAGHAALVFKRPDNDMALIYRAVLDLEERVAKHDHKLQENPAYIEDVAYQTALDDLRGATRELDLQHLAYYWRHDGLFLVILAWCSWLAWLILSPIVVIGGFVLDDRRGHKQRMAQYKYGS